MLEIKKIFSSEINMRCMKYFSTHWFFSFELFDNFFVKLFSIFLFLNRMNGHSAAPIEREIKFLSQQNFLLVISEGYVIFLFI